jgi:hypothetical protein
MLSICQREEIPLPPIPDGAAMENDHGYVVGYCHECRYMQYKLYRWKGFWYCLRDFVLVKQI